MGKFLHYFLVLAILFACSSVVQKNTVNEASKKKSTVQIKTDIRKKTDKYFHQVQNTKVVKKYCKKVNDKFLYWGWGNSHCWKYQWNHVRNSVLGTPLIWTVFGDEKEHQRDKHDVTMVMCGVHGDEITPIKFCFDLVEDLNKKYNANEELEGKLVVIAPIVSPDSFFKKRPTRTNARGVDLNRNFPTKDWDKDALRLWKSRYRSDKRRYPGKHAHSEPETVFQVNLIKRYRPNKIISVHAPLTILDYDGPDAALHEGGMIGSKANELLITMSRKAGGYRIKNYPFFPGSLGNYAGNERKIPTYTLELPSSDNRRSKEFWNMFGGAVYSAIKNNLLTNSEDQDLADTVN